MQSEDRLPLALFISDIHFSMRPPIWRSAEEDWFEAMRRPIIELSQIQDELNVPIFCAGDIFDKWYGAHQSSSLVNFVIDTFSFLHDVYVIAGQHDLPNHSYDRIKESALWTLLEAEAVRILHPGTYTTLRYANDSYLRVHPFPYGTPITEPEEKVDGVDVCMAHQYVWSPGHSFHGAPEEARVSNRKELTAYDVAVFGDNHIGFQAKVGNTLVWNCGSLLRRKSDEVKYKPRVGVLYSDKTMEARYLDIEQDKSLELDSSSSNEKEELDMSEFIGELSKLGSSSLDFTEAVKQYIIQNNVSKGVQEALLVGMGIQE